MSDADPRHDAEARRLAQSLFDRPLLLEAGAGTGKTATLVNRIVAWLLTEGWERARTLTEDASDTSRVAALTLERTVAITFTDAAAAEMAARVESGLVAYGSGRLEQLKGFEPDLLGLDQDEGRRRASALLAALDRLVIRTIHAWCRRLLARYPIEAGLGAEFDVDADGSVSDRAAREVLEEELPFVYTHPELGRDALRLARERKGPDALLEALVGLAAEALPPEELERESCDDELVRMVRGRLQPSLDVMLRAFAACGDRVSGLSDITQQALEELGAVASALRAPADEPVGWMTALSAALGALDRAKDRLKTWTTKGMGTREAASLEAGMVAGIEEAAPALRGSLEELAGLDVAGFEARRRILAHLYPKMLSRIREAGVLTFGELLRGAGALFATHPEILAEVRRGIDHLLVDEFQDTDALQCGLVRQLAFEGPEDERPSLFVVGDPKQSIYAWREADLAAYDAFKSEVEDAGGAIHGLFVNYRSTAPILEEVSAVIRPLMRPRIGVQPEFQELLAGRERPEGGAVEHWVAWSDDADGGGAKTRSDEASAIEAQAIALDIVARAGSGESYGSMAVLLRSTSKLEILLDAFREAGVPYVVARDRSYYRRREVIDAAALVRAILDPGDLVAHLTWLRSSMVGVPDAALAYLWQAGLPAALSGLGAGEDALDAAHAAIDEACRQMRGLDGLALGLDRVPEWSAMIRAGVESLAALRRSFEEDPADVFVETLRRISLVEAAESGRYLAPFRVANLERFLGELVTALEESGGNVQEVLRALRRAVAQSLEAEEARPEDYAAEAVNVLTIHRAKGLDFDTVYVPQLHRGSAARGGDSRSSAKQREGRWEIKLIGTPGPRALLQRARDAEIAAAERVRLLYVAMTRARERLVLSGCWFPARADESAMVNLLPTREGGHPDLGTRFDEALAGKSAALEDRGALWRFPIADLRRAGPAARGARTRDPLDVDAMLAGAHRLRGARSSARAWRRGPASAAISQLSHESYRDIRGRALDEAEAEDETGTAAQAVLARDETRARIARLSGTFVHKVLELLDLSRPLSHESLESAVHRARAHLASLNEFRDVGSALEEAGSVLHAFETGPLATRFEAVREHVVARELPLLVPPEIIQSTATRFASGVIDLVYRDPEGGNLVVADFKTDRLEGTSAGKLAERYGPQLMAYARALADGWGLDDTPRSELWLLRAGIVVEWPR